MFNPESETNPLRKIPVRAVPVPACDVGAVLRKARMKKGQALDAVCQHTRISRRFIEAMEANRFEEFPALAYLRGFLKSYCEYLEVDFEGLWKSSFPEPVGGLEPQAAADAGKRPKTPPPAAPPQTPPPSGAGAAALALAAGGALVLALVLRGGGSRPSEREPSPAAIPALLQPMSAPAQPHLMLEFRREAWMRVAVDGTTRFEGLVPAGARQEWNAKSFILLRTPDADAVSLTLNGAPQDWPPADAAGDHRIEAPGPSAP